MKVVDIEEVDHPLHPFIIPDQSEVEGAEGDLPKPEKWHNSECPLNYKHDKHLVASGGLWQHRPKRNDKVGDGVGMGNKGLSR